MNQEELSQSLSNAALGIAVVTIGTLLIWWVISRASSRARRHFEQLLNVEKSTPGETDGRLFSATQRRLTALKLLVNTARYVLFFGAGLMIFHQLGVKLDSLVLPAGFLGAALGLGAQSLIKDVVAGLFIIFEGQFSVGDVVSINGTLGVIEEVGLRVTRLRADNGQLYFFSNGSITLVAKYPSRHVALDLWAPIENAEQRSRAETIIAEAIEAFETRYRVLEEAPVPTNLDDETPASTTIHYRLYVRPARVATVNEKLPLHLTKTLESAEIALQTDAPIEITSAPM